ncbi:hypothetical protein [Pinirhizobacter sp.]|jgi:hypothetical protein|uniref:hypothetical protein n=1 Tax=Pinirhizobacter sp. TaxID=2950432 RepID=UPI002F3E3B43
MTKTVSLPDDVYAQLATLARPFVDREPSDVIRRLVVQEILALGNSSNGKANSAHSMKLVGRAPRERGVTIMLDGTAIDADTVPDLIEKVAAFLFDSGYWSKLLAIAPYKTSSRRYLFSKTPVHPSGKNFFSELKYRDLYFEVHKNYATSLEQLRRLLGKLGINLTF